MNHWIYKSVALLVLPLTLFSCTTTYDAQGNPQQSVDPGTAAAAAAGAAAVGYAIGRNNNDKYYYYGGRRYYGRPPYRPHPHR